MKKIILVIIIITYSASVAIAQTADKYAVQISATIQTNPPKITLNWVGNTSATSYNIYKKLKTTLTSWGAVYVSLPGTATTYTDSNIVEGESYEYKIQMSGATTAYGYINTGIKVAETANRGKLLLVVDTTYLNYFSEELELSIIDFEGDGWSVVRINVDQNDSVPDIKSRIVNEYSNDPVNTEAVFLFGHVPVPYSGNLNPDGHPDHKGAWPADVYYGEMNGNWTDNSINYTVATGTRNDNVPGDGKFDQTAIPSNIELQVGRVDFANLPAFAQSEQELLKLYLDKNHKYKHKIITAQRRALIDDHFGGFSGEAFAATGWKNFPALVGANNIDKYDYDDTLKNNSYLWSYGCGAGSYTSCSNVVNTARLASDSMQSIFTVLFGSYFGDWDADNNLLRAALASGTILTNFWSGRPHWQFHHMAMGENIGYSARLTQNNSTMYYASYAGKWVHIALMGDPTLKETIVSPPSNLIATYQNATATLSWLSSNDSIIGYNIYRKSDTINYFTLVNNSPVSDTFYVDNSLVHSGNHIYLVRALKLEETPSGSYYNLSQGIFDTIMSTAGIQSTEREQLSFTIYPNPTSDKLNIHINIEEHTECDILIFNIQGQLVKSETLKGISGKQTLVLNTVDLNDGIYTLRIVTPENMVCRKFVKVNGRF